jgi:hypothetical protein
VLRQDQCGVEPHHGCTDGGSVATADGSAASISNTGAHSTAHKPNTELLHESLQMPVAERPRALAQRMRDTGLNGNGQTPFPGLG